MNLDPLWADLTTELLTVLASYRSRVTELDRQEKADHTLLTEADLAVEDMIIRKIRAVDPEARVLAEESGSGAWRPGHDEEPERIWVIDPIDGTAEFVNPRSTEFCSVVCLLERREPVAALIVAPELGDGGKPIVVVASRANQTITVNGSVAAYNSESVRVASLTRSARSEAPPHETAMAEAGYALKTRTTSQTLDMLRTALNLTDLTTDAPRFDLFYRPRQKVWDGLAGLCLGEIVGLMSTDVNGSRHLPVPMETLAQPEPTFASTVMGRPEAVKWFVELARDSPTGTPKSS
ncbi:inositol monophosphatase family protein [Verrucosispora sp. WMMA2121]|uniref:inositol monophosphatase family protein n=1 Tax=Verrucosispora sp. WMMA2121 TaxID=3015164 RepID=UPI0022B654C1|nr:inositol monophosphatase family protein [Verrucosispora sp. WMMA2121]MCZ7422436.1 inositol monophosphatase family protein [Verrucosispora sp. WMMA2121]